MLNEITIFLVCCLFTTATLASIITGEIPLSKVAQPPLANNCPNNCSYPNGNCDPNNWCVCNPSYGSLDCSVTIIGISLNQKAEEMTLLPHTWALYNITMTDTFVQLLVNMKNTGVGGDPDLYVRYGDWPTAAQYDYADFTVGNDSYVSITRDQADKPLQNGQYYIGVFAYGDQNATFTVEPRAYSCPNDCNRENGNGWCNFATHTCDCQPGWTLPDCSASTVSLANPLDIRTGALLPMQWMFFVLTVSQEQEFNDVDWSISVNRTADARLGFMEVYVQYLKPPTLQDYLYASARDQFINTVDVCSSKLAAGDYHVGVYNWGFDTLNFTLTSELVINCPNRCSFHGHCLTSGSCECDSGWIGGDCSVEVASVRAGTVSSGAAVGIALTMILVGAIIALVINHFWGAQIAAKFRSLRESQVSEAHVQAPSGTYSTF